MNKGIFITVACCMGFMALILALFLSRFYTPRELTQDEYKALGAYFVDPPRQLAGPPLAPKTEYFQKIRLSFG